MVGLQKVLIRINKDLRQLKQRWSLIGGLAVSARSEPRTTRDHDVAVAVSGDREAENLVADLRARGYVVETLLELKISRTSNHFSKRQGPRTSSKDELCCA